MRTSRIGLGTFVATPNFRHPVPFAKELMTLDVMSQGRLIMGLGAGGPGFDAAMLGGPELTPRQRADRYEEFVVVIDQVLRQPTTTWTGQWFRAVEARSIPGPTQRPRPQLIIAGNGPRGMRLALSLGDGWVTTGMAPFGTQGEQWWQGVEAVVHRFDNVSRDTSSSEPEGFRRVLDLQPGAGYYADSRVDTLYATLARAAGLSFTDAVIAWPRTGQPHQGSLAVLEGLADRLSPDGTLR